MTRLQRLRAHAKRRGLPLAKVTRLWDVADLCGAATRRAGRSPSSRVVRPSAREWRADLYAARKVGALPGGLPEISPRAAILAGLVAAMKRGADADEMKLWTRAAVDLNLLRETTSGYELRRRITFSRETDGRWIASMSGVPLAGAYGRTKVEATRRLREAVAFYDEYDREVPAVEVRTWKEGRLWTSHADSVAGVYGIGRSASASERDLAEDLGLLLEHLRPRARAPRVVALLKPRPKRRTS